MVSTWRRSRHAPARWLASSAAGTARMGREREPRPHDVRAPAAPDFARRVAALVVVAGAARAPDGRRADERRAARDRPDGAPLGGATARVTAVVCTRRMDHRRGGAAAPAGAARGPPTRGLALRRGGCVAA